MTQSRRPPSLCPLYVTLTLVPAPPPPSPFLDAEPKHILELGTFTGYATLCLAEGQGLALGQGSVSVDTCDIDPLACDIAQR